MGERSEIPDQQARARVEACFSRHHAAVYRYALRRTGDPGVAEEVSAEVFAVVWRRHSELGEDPLPWLYGVARKTIANQHRSRRRRRRLGLKLLGDASGAGGSRGGADVVADSDAARWALGQLREADRELLMLIAWEGLGQAEAARALGCSEATLRVRLSRARSRLERIMSRSGLLENDLPITASESKGAPR